jgi:hypothetical protein
MRATMLASCLLVVGCSDTPPSAYQHPRDQFFAAIPLTMINDDFNACFRTVDGRPGRLSDEDCYRFNDPERMRGVLIAGFETSSFYPGRTTPPAHDERSGYWMDVPHGVLPADLWRRCGAGCAIRLDFIGRRTAVQGGYGHMSLASHMIIVDRVIEATPLE